MGLTTWKYKLYVYVMLKPRTWKRILMFAIPILTIVAIGYYVKVRREEATWCERMKQNMSCHLLPSSYEDFPPFTGPKVSNDKEMPPNSKKNFIFFHEKSCKGSLTLLEACSVESAARAHPDWTVYVLFSAPFPTNSAFWNVQRYVNVIYHRVHIKEYVKGTPLDQETLNTFNWSFKYSDAEDILRYTTLYKYPGIYLDLNVIVVRSLENLGRNFAVRLYEDSDIVGSGVVAFGDDELGRTVANTAVVYTRKDLSLGRPADDPGVLTRVLKSRCNSSSPSIYCNFTVYNQIVSMPIFDNYSIFYLPGENDDDEIESIHMYYFKHYHSNCYSLDPEEDRIFHKLASLYCPAVYTYLTGEEELEANDKKVKKASVLLFLFIAFIFIIYYTKPNFFKLQTIFGDKSN